MLDDPSRPVTLADPLDRDAVAVVVAAVRCALAVEFGWPQVGAVVDWTGTDVAEIQRAIRVHRVAPVLAAQAEAVDAPNDLRDAVRALARAETIRALELGRDTVHVTRILADEGIDALVLKGSALSVQSTGRLGPRGGGADVDVLVRPTDIAAAHAALLAAGWSADELGETGRLWRWYLRMRRERSYVSERSAVDLHWRVGWHDRPLPPVDVLLERAVQVDIAGTPVPTLAPSDALAAACYHAEMDRYARLRSLVDVVRLVRRPDTGPVAGDNWRLRRLMGEAVTFCAGLLGGVDTGRLAAFAPHGGVDVSRVEDMWASSSTRPVWFVSDVPLGELIGIYRDSARFAGAFPAFEMALTDALVPPERISADAGPLALAGVVSREIADLVRRRVRIRG